MRTSPIYLAIVLTMAACANEVPPRPSDPLTTPLEAVENLPPKDDRVFETRRVEGFELENSQIGKIRYMSTGFSTIEGDFCNLFVSIEHGFISAHDGTWRGQECPWPKDGRHVPLDREALQAIVDAIEDDASGLKVHAWVPQKQAVDSRATITTDRDEYEMSTFIEDTLVAQANRLLEKWLSRDVEGPLPDLFTVAALDNKYVGARLEPHGILVMTITESTGSVNRLWVLDDRDLAEIRELTEAHYPTDWTDGESGKDEFMINHGGKLTRYWPHSAPAAVHRLLELTAAGEHGE